MTCAHLCLQSHRRATMIKIPPEMPTLSEKIRSVMTLAITIQKWMMIVSISIRQGAAIIAASLIQHVHPQCIPTDTLRHRQ